MDEKEGYSHSQMKCIQIERLNYSTKISTADNFFIVGGSTKDLATCAGTLINSVFSCCGLTGLISRISVPQQIEAIHEAHSCLKFIASFIGA